MPSTAGTAGRIRVLVCDDSAFMRKALSGLINSDPGLIVIDTARNGQEAVEKAKKLSPDVITLDIEMPIMNGHQALTAIKRECRDLPEGCPQVLVCSSLTSSGSHDALQALREGAADIIAKDASFFSTNMDAMREDLVTKIKAIGSSRALRNKRAMPVTGMTQAAALGTGQGMTQGTAGASIPAKAMNSLAAAHIAANQAAAATMDLKAISLATRKIDLISIGSSTGGPPILEQILAQVPPGLPCPIVIAQHMPPSFTKAMSERLDGMCAISVIHGEHGMPLHAGTAYVIPGGKHGRVRAIGAGPIRLEVSDDPRTAPFKPSVNELLASSSRQCGKNVLGIVLTGIGDDGRIGAIELKAGGGVLVAQDPASSVVYGMPKACADVGGASMTPDQIAQTIASLVSAGARSAA